MKGFRFKLQPVLKVKELEEDRLLEEYAFLRKAHAEVVERREGLEQKKEDQLNSLQAAEGEGFLDIDQAMLHRNYLAHLRNEIAVAREEEHQKKEELDEGFQRLVEKTKERKILEKLKEKHQAIFVADQLKKMQNELDDLAQGRFNHQKSKHLEAET